MKTKGRKGDRKFRSHLLEILIGNGLYRWNKEVQDAHSDMLNQMYVVKIRKFLRNMFQRQNIETRIKSRKKKSST